MILSNHLILCHPLLLLPSIFPSIKVFSNELALRIRWPNYWSFSFSISVSNEYSGLIFFWTDLFDLFQSKGLSRVFSSTTIQKHQFFSAQPSLCPTLTSVGDYWENHSFHYVDFCWQSDVWCTTICNSVFCVWLGRSLADLVWSWLATNGYRWDSLDNWSDSSPHSSHFWDQSVTWCCQYTLGQSPVSHTLGQSPPLNVGSTPSQGNSAAACREVQSNK